MDEQRFAIIKLRRAWADGHTFIWLVIVIAIVVGMSALFPLIGLSEGDRGAALVLLSVILVVSAVWRAADMTVARVHMIVRGMRLEAGTESGRNG